MEIQQANLMTERKWNIKGLVWCHALIAFLLISFFSPVTQGYWEFLDISIFKWLNHSLRGNEKRQLFWAMANHRLADWVEDVMIFIFYALHVKKTVKERRPKSIAELIFCVFYSALIIIFINRCLFRYIIIIHRDSPCLAVENSIHLSDQIPWMSIKDVSSRCFPGDHATTALLFAASYCFLAPRRLGIFASLYAVFLCLPRMAAGAHWFSDVVVGSGSLVLFFLGWAFCTPFFSFVTTKCERLFLALKNFNKKSLYRT